MKADILTKTWIAAILAIFCSALWGSAFPCVKIGYGLFGVDTSQPMSLILFAGIRFFAAGIMVIITGSIMHKKTACSENQGTAEGGGSEPYADDFTVSVLLYRTCQYKRREIFRH